MTTLHDRLVDLAEVAPEALPAPGLWDRDRDRESQARDGLARLRQLPPDLEVDDPVTAAVAAPPPR
jgi:hypothetical protein